MNQILVNEKIYSTPELRRKKKFYRLEFFLSVFLLCLLTSFYIYAEYDKNKSEAVSQKILSAVGIESDPTLVSKEENDVIVVILNAPAEQQIIEQLEEPEPEPATYTENGIEYTTIGRIKISKINVDYPILETTDERMDDDLKIAPCKFWGPNPNEVGNLCIVGHNYRNRKFFSKVPTLQNGDIIQIIDMSGRTIDYAVYDKHNVDPTDVRDTTQKTHGKTEITLITCTDDSKERVIVKAREI